MIIAGHHNSVAGSSQVEVARQALIERGFEPVESLEELDFSSVVVLQEDEEMALALVRLTEINSVSSISRQNLFRTPTIVTSYIPYEPGVQINTIQGFLAFLGLIEQNPWSSRVHHSETGYSIFEVIYTPGEESSGFRMVWPQLRTASTHPMNRRFRMDPVTLGMNAISGQEVSLITSDMVEANTGEFSTYDILDALPTELRAKAHGLLVFDRRLISNGYSPDLITIEQFSQLTRTKFILGSAIANISIATRIPIETIQEARNEAYNTMELASYAYSHLRRESTRDITPSSEMDLRILDEIRRPLAEIQTNNSLPESSALLETSDRINIGQIDYNWNQGNLYSLQSVLISFLREQGFERSVDLQHATRLGQTFDLIFYPHNGRWHIGTIDSFRLNEMPDRRVIFNFASFAYPEEVRESFNQLSEQERSNLNWFGSYQEWIEGCVSEVIETSLETVDEHNIRYQLAGLNRIPGGSGGAENNNSALIVPREIFINQRIELAISILFTSRRLRLRNLFSSRSRADMQNQLRSSNFLTNLRQRLRASREISNMNDTELLSFVARQSEELLNSDEFQRRNNVQRLGANRTFRRRLREGDEEPERLFRAFEATQRRGR